MADHSIMGLFWARKSICKNPNLAEDVHISESDLYA